LARYVREELDGGTALLRILGFEEVGRKRVNEWAGPASVACTHSDGY